MLYNKSAVANPVAETPEQLSFAERHSPFNLEAKTQEDIKSRVSPKLRGLNLVKRIVGVVHSNVIYKHNHDFKGGSRTADETWHTGEGHCIEQGVLLYAALKLFGFEPGFLMVKNPRGYDSGATGSFGVHPFMTLEFNGRTYLADAVPGDVKVKPLRDSFCVAEQPLTFREAVAYFMMDRGDELGQYTDKFPEALSALETALKIDPNNYTIHSTVAEVLTQQKDFTAAEAAHRRAIRMVPNLLDPWKYLGDFFQDDRKNGRDALSRDTADFEILQDIALQASATYIFASFRNAQLYRAMFNEYHDCDEAISLSKDVMESAASKFKEVIAKRRIPKAAVWKMLEKKQEFGAEYEKRIDEFNALCKQLNLKLSDSALVEVRL